MSGPTRGLFMHYNMKKIFVTTALALIFGLTCSGNVMAQAAISLSDDAKKADTQSAANEIPDEISLFGDDGDDILTPPAKTEPETAKTENKPEAAKDDKQAPSETAAPGLPVLDMPAQPENVEKPQIPAIPVIPAPAAQQAPQPAAIPEPKQQVPVFSQLGSQIIEDIDDDVFAKMSDLEKETAVLNLELRKEKVKNDIEALRAMRDKAQEEEEARKHAEKLKQIALEKEEERKILLEQQKLKNLEIVYEKERQEKLLKAYKNKMLEESQKWIERNAENYKEIADLKNERQKLINDFKGKFVQLTKMADEATNEAIRVRDNYAKTISDLQTQISILNARLEASEKTNPFAENGGEQAAPLEEEEALKLSDLYAVMEIRGKGKNLSAKLINESGAPFFVKVGTVLQSGHVVDEISSTYVRADKEGSKDYLYFSAGGVLDQEPVTNEELKVKVSDPEQAPAPSGIVSNQGIPGIAREMTVR